MIGPHRPVPRQNLTTGPALIVNGTAGGRIAEVRHETVVVLETFEGFIEDDPFVLPGERVVLRYSDADPCPIVADILPDPVPTGDGA